MASVDWAESILNRTAKIRSVAGGRQGTFDVGTDGCLEFKPSNGSMAARAIVLTIPKAGTYLIARFLAEMGMVDLEIHAWLGGYSDYRWLESADKIERANEFTVNLPVELVAALVRPGQFFVGHLPCDWRCTDALSGFAKLVAIRDLRDVAVSFMRFEYRRLVADINRSPATRAWITRTDSLLEAYLAAEGGELMTIVEGVVSWRDRSDVSIVRFEELLGDFGDDCRMAAFKRLSDTVEPGRSESDIERAVRNTVNLATPTFSGKRSNRADHWTPAAEREFGKIGGYDFNQVLGYT